MHPGGRSCEYAAFRRDYGRTAETAAMNRTSFRGVLVGLTALLCCVAKDAASAQTVTLGANACRTENLFANGFGEDADVETGLLTRQFGGRTHYLVLPPGYREDQTQPLLLALHGTGGSPAGAMSNALAIAQTWQPIARRSGMLVVVPIGSSPGGSWNPSADLPYLDQLRGHVATEFSVDATRHYLWGFSAGAHFGHGVALDRSSQFAAYAIAAGLLNRFVCPAALALSERSVGKAQPSRLRKWRSRSPAYAVPASSYNARAKTASGDPTCAAYLAAVPRKIPLDISSGISDPVVPINEISADEGRFRNAGWHIGTNLWVRGLNQGHTYSDSQLQDSWNAICRFAVVPD